MDQMAGFYLSHMLDRARQRASNNVVCRTVEPDADPAAFLRHASSAILENEDLTDEAKAYAVTIMAEIYGELMNGHTVDAATIRETVNDPSNLFSSPLVNKEKRAIAELLIDAHEKSCTLGDVAKGNHDKSVRTF